MDGLIPGLLWMTCSLCHNSVLWSHVACLGKNDNWRISLRLTCVIEDHDIRNTTVWQESAKDA